MTLLTIVVPAYNAADHLRRALDSLRIMRAGMEVIIVNDGSTDETGVIADAYVAERPDLFHVIHKENGGHGSAINAGLERATGRYLKVLDSDDWLDPHALNRVIETLDRLGHEIDALVTDYIHEREGKRPKSTRFATVMPTSRIFEWDEVDHFSRRQYLMMHALIYRTDLVRASGMHLPEHTFYVDNLYVVVPITKVRRLYHLDVGLYHYAIGRPGQSVDEEVMIRQVDQQLQVNRLVLNAMPAPGEVPPGLYRYLLHHVEILCAITSIMLVRAGTPHHLAQREEFWNEIKHESPWVYARVRRSIVGTSANLPGVTGRRVSIFAYQMARRVVGFS